MDDAAVSVFSPVDHAPASVGECRTGIGGADVSGFAQGEAGAAVPAGLSMQIQPEINTASAAGQTYQAMRYRLSNPHSAE